MTERRRPTGLPGRGFSPDYVMLAPVYECNLTCPHCCVPIEWTDRLDIPIAVRFLEDAHAAGIEMLGFTGGEPFLYPDVLLALTRRAAELGFRFDKLMTNGVWHRDARARTKQRSRNSAMPGFTGKLGLSVDKFHGMDIGEARRVLPGRADGLRAATTILSLSYASRAPDRGWSRSNASRKHSTAWSNGRTCSAATCS